MDAVSDGGVEVRLQIPSAMTGAKFLPSGWNHYRKWFSFECRCFLCGRKFDPSGLSLDDHLMRHVREGYMEQEGVSFRQVKSNPIGFPGILLPTWMSKPSACDIAGGAACKTTEP